MTSVLTPDTMHQATHTSETSVGLLKAMVDATPDPLAVMNTDFVYLACNAAYLRFLGKSEGEIVGNTDFDLFPEEEAEQCRQDYLHLLDTGEPVLRDMHVTYAQGGRVFQVVKMPLRNGEGPIEGIVLTIRDITERKQAEESDQLQAGRYATLLRTSNEAFWIMGTDGTFSDVNQAFCDIYGYSREEMLGMHISELEVLETPEETARHIEQVIENGHERFETRHRKKDGSTINVEISTSYWSPSGEFLVFCRDITERRRADAQQRKYEAALRKARKIAEHESESKTRFLATASHDLRQPIQAMHLLAHVLVSSDLPPESAEIALRMQEAVDGLGDMLTALLDISKLDAGLVKPDLSDFRLSELFQQLTEEHLPQAEDKGVTLRCVDCRLRVRSDLNLLTRILRNLLSNAIKYTRSGKVLIGVRHAGECVRIQVLDTGIGIAEDELERVFEEFHQVGNTARDRREGLGLGLAIVKRLSTLLEHPVQVASVVGHGTCFSVQVPLAVGSSARQRDVADFQLPLEIPYEGAEILVVDDEVDIREGLAMNLRQWGYAVSVAADYDQALAALKEDSPPVLVIADYRLGAETGIDVIRAVRRWNRRKIAAVLLTGDATEARVRESARLGVQLLRKPVSAEQLRRAVVDNLKGT